MAENREITLFSEPEELIAWAEVYDKQINPSIEDAKLYRVGKLKKRPYSQVWKYREDIRKMHKLQEQYLFLARHNIHSAEELVGTIASLTDKKKETSAEKSRIYKARERSMELFTAADEMENLKPAEQSYRLGAVSYTHLTLPTKA